MSIITYVAAISQIPFELLLWELFFFLSFLQTVNDRADDPDARPMLYDPLQGSKITKSRQYLATVIGT